MPRYGQRYVFIAMLCVSLFSLIRSAVADKYEDYFEDRYSERSRNFLVYYEPGVDMEFVKDIKDYLERYYTEISERLGFHRYQFWSYDDRARVYIFRTKESYVKVTGQPEWSGGCADYRKKRFWTYPHAAGFFDSTLPHELGHIIFREVVGFGRNIPLWLDEGVASYQEMSHRYTANDSVREIIAQGRLMSYDDMLAVRGPHDLNQAQADIFYAQATSMVYFLIKELGKHRFPTLCHYLEDHMSLDEALDRTYYRVIGEEDFYKKWLEYVKKK